jgi:hypothetical protein
MKKLLFTALAICLYTVTSFAQSDAISQYFSKYAEDERFTVVYVSPKMFEMISKISTTDPEWQRAREVIKDLKGLRILVANNDDQEGENGQKIVQTNKINGQAMYKEAMATLNGKSYDELLTVRDGQQNVRFMVKESGGLITELLLLVGEPNEFVMLSFTGIIDLDKIASLGNALNVEGAEHLEKIKQKN